MAAVETSASNDSEFSRLSALPSFARFSSLGPLRVHSLPGSPASPHIQGPGVKEEEEGRAEKNLTAALAPLKEFP